MLRKTLTIFSLVGLLAAVGCTPSISIEVEGCPGEDDVVSIGTDVRFVITVHPEWISDVAVETRAVNAIVEGFDTPEPIVTPVAGGTVEVHFTALTGYGAKASEPCVFEGFACVCSPGEETCDDGSFCTGREFCLEDCSACVAPGNPYGANEYCNEQIDACVLLCETDPDCDDGDVCTIDACGDGNEDGVRTCSYTPINCDDDDYCTLDTCDPLGGCMNAPVECLQDEICVEGTCALACIDDADCHEGQTCDVALGACFGR